MSGRLIGKVLRQAATRRPTARLVLIVIAEHAGDNGAGSRVSAETIAKETGLSRRSVLRLIPQLVASGDLSVDHRAGPHKVHRYVVHPGGDGDSVSPPDGDSVSPRRAVHGDNVSRPAVTTGARSGDRLTPKPLEPPTEPSEILPREDLTARAKRLHDVIAANLPLVNEGLSPVVRKAAARAVERAQEELARLEATA